MKAVKKKAGIASSSLCQSISLKLDSIIQPTTIKTGAVAAIGTALIGPAKKIEAKKQRAVMQLAKPVLAPAPIPLADSTKVVVLLVPKIAPIEVATLSANKARSKLNLHQ